MKNLQNDLNELEERAALIKEAIGKCATAEGTRSYHKLGHQGADLAHKIYMSLAEEIRISPSLAINRFRSSQCLPDHVDFWKDPDAIVGLYEALKKDGYYAEKASTSCA